MNPSTTNAARRPHRRIMAVGAVAAALSVAGSGAALAVAPTSSVGKAVSGALAQVGVDWSSMPDGYTREQYEAFWGAGYTPEDVAALGALWSTDDTETKARAGQLLLDGEPVPIAPGSTAGEVTTPDAGPEQPAAGAAPADADEWASMPDGYTQAQYEAFWGAGYTVDDVEALGALWSTEATETKARAGQMLLDGQTPPVAPGSTPASASS
ncbi:hypothetical protein Cch01nite_06180 [Cellulomonas chitinilytica]|uniref:Secreted protein n=1 Tax=Cellulomonas chitinilytica TaxID=398759 RepID=A0A919P1S9_9CELL|nr:hypothetical protein [Cellulomonas chitinilytica]GIG19894.1 hypothetical protein Cch01nite_06180 [Cellulomonas chitinilytica]